MVHSPYNTPPKDPKKRLDEREKAFEAKYQFDDALAFKAGVRRAKLMGLWAAGRLGLAEGEGADYAKRAVEADLADPGHAALLEMLRRDLAAAGRDADIEDLSRQMMIQEQTAREQVEAENPRPIG
ncbi:MAG: DUF1476 domain-containing protein [Telmatospirillum sp.]|nr:DUF1476 domain-containing protein [Telmatospirillum sp.]